jgi:hypothetical protein
MGRDLYLLPLDYLSRDRNWGYSHTVLNCPRNYELYDAIEKRDPIVIQDIDVSCYMHVIEGGDSEGEYGYGALPKTDPYGDPMTWLPASQLVPAFRKHLPKHPITAYLGALEPEVLVVLYWH